MTERHKLRKRQSQAEIAKRQSDYGRTDRGIKSGLISHAKSRALDHDETFNMTIDTISELPTHCPNPFCRVKLEVAVVRGGSDNSYSLDKIDRTKPYDGNWRIVCRRCNRLRSDATAAELSGIARWEQGLLPLVIRRFSESNGTALIQHY
jgi:hypothetical protein